MKIKFVILTILIVFLTTCQSQDLSDVLDGEIEDSEQFEDIRHDIIVNILTSRYDGFKRGEKPTRAINDFVLTPFVIDGDTVLYIAQYTDGWEIYSATHAANMLLFSSEKGVFDINDPEMPPQLKALILGNASLISELNKASVDTVDSSWESVALSRQLGENSVITMINEDCQLSRVNLRRKTLTSILSWDR